MPKNPAVAQLIRHACTARGWGPTDLARAVGRAESGDPARLQRQYALRWLKGNRTPAYWWPYIAQVLNLDIRVIDAPHTQPPADAGTDTVASALELGRSDVDRRNFVTASSGYALAALGLPDPDSITRRTKNPPAGAVRVGKGEVAAVQRMVISLGDSAAELGGGHARHLAVRYLTDDVAPWLNGSFTEATGRALFAAASQLMHLAGWMAQDEGDTPELRGLAQGYYAHAFRLAAEAGDPELSATALPAWPSSASTSASGPRPSSSAKPASNTAKTSTTPAPSPTTRRPSPPPRPRTTTGTWRPSTSPRPKRPSAARLPPPATPGRRTTRPAAGPTNRA